MLLGTCIYAAAHGQYIKLNLGLLISYLEFKREYINNL